MMLMQTTTTAGEFILSRLANSIHTINKRKTVTFLFLLTGLYTMSAIADSQAKGKIMTNSDKIISVVKKMSSAMERGKIEDVLAAYEQGASLVVQPGMTASGSELREAFKGFISMKPKFNMPQHEVIESGDIALHISPWTMDATDPATGKPIQQGGLSLAVFRRQPDGNWLMVIDNPYGAALLPK